MSFLESKPDFKGKLGPNLFDQIPFTQSRLFLEKNTHILQQQQKYS